MRVVVDASVVAKWVLPSPAGEEPDAGRAVELLRGIQRGDHEPLQPPHWLAEVAAVVARLVPGRADEVLDLLDALELPTADGVPLYKRAASLAQTLGHHLFHTLYHAVALDEGGTLVTADERYWRKARGLGAVVRLADWPPEPAPAGTRRTEMPETPETPAAAAPLQPLWSPSPERAAATRLAAFIAWLRAERGIEAPDYAAVHRLSIDRPGTFWSAVWDFAGVAGERAEEHGGEGAVGGDGTIAGTRFFAGSHLNFAENLLAGAGGGEGDRDAVVFRGEDRVRRRLSWNQLRAEAGRVAGALAAEGVLAGDRVAAWLPNLPEGIAGMLGAASVGAVWSSCSPDFGVEGVLDRFGQIEPRVLLAADGYVYGGKRHDCLARLREIRRRLPSVERVVVVPYAPEEAVEPDLAGVEGAVSWAEWLEPHPPEPAFERLPFDHPLYVLFSSGTTGPPKCIVHRAGGILLKHLCELQFQVDVRPGDRVFYFSTLGWMMWNWLASALASGATILLYDGSPFHPGPEALWDYAEEEGMTLFGTSARYLDALRNAGYEPKASHDLGALRTLCSTGSPLAPESFDFVYRAVKDDLHLASISGGTDICGCFVAGDPTGPVHRGEIQAPGLGMAVEVFDGDGRPRRAGEAGELVCTRPFPCAPLGFWNDPGGERFRAAYFERFPGVWHHGDWTTRTEHGGWVIHGRSDATLNPGGVRIGTAEIYRQVDGTEEVLESLAIGQQWDGDVRVVLFVRLRPGAELDGELEERLRRRIREHASPRHVPAKIVAVADLPRTRSGKLVELAVRDAVHGREVANREALANPEALELFRDLPELRE